MDTNNLNEIKSSINNIKDNNILLDDKFQTKLIKLIIEDEKFSEQILEILKPEYFDSIFTKIILKYIIDYYNKYNLLPEYDTINNLINEKESDSLVKEKLIDLLHILKDLNVTDKQYVKDISIDFCRKQSLKKGLLEAADSWEKGDYELIQKIITDSIKLGEIKDTGHNYIQDLEKRLIRQFRKPVPCLDRLDEQIGGGLSGGELGVILSPTGGGKSMMLVKFASTAIQLGKKVIYYSLELAERVIGNRFDACLTDIQLKNILDNPDAIRERLEEIKQAGGNLMIKEFPTGSATVNTIRNHIKTLERDNFIPDEIFVDYADIMKPTSTYVEKRHSLTQIYESLRALSMELNVPIWTASQAGRQAINSARFDLSVISESLGKAQTADVILGLARTDENKREKKAQLIVLKNRNGNDGFELPLLFDTSKVFIAIDNSNSPSYGLEGIANHAMMIEQKVIQSIDSQLSETDFEDN